MSTDTQTACVGRPRAFDTESALEKALEVFWLKGFEGASLTDLTQAMGINKPSLYAAFGNKEQLFLKAIELYEQRPCAFFYPSLEQKTAYQVAEAMLYGAASTFVDQTHPQGCLIVQGALACSEAGQAIKDTLITRRRDGEQALCERLQRAKDEGDLPSSANPIALARYLGTVVQGMAVQATNGICPQELRQVAELALANFPRVTQTQ